MRGSKGWRSETRTISDGQMGGEIAQTAGTHVIKRRERRNGSKMRGGGDEPLEGKRLTRDCGDGRECRQRDGGSEGRSRLFLSLPTRFKLQNARGRRGK